MSFLQLPIDPTGGRAISAASPRPDHASCSAAAADGGSVKGGGGCSKDGFIKRLVA